MIDTVGPEYSPNITPDVETGAGAWTDDVLVRAIREGYGHDGRPLLPSMRSEYYKAFTDEDIASVVVYLRSLPPVRHELPRNNLPEDKRGFREEFVEEVPSVRNSNDTLAHGAYLVRIAICEHCHSPLDGFGERKPGLRFGGGTVGVEDSLHPVISKNLTRDPTGIAYYDPNFFVQTIRTGRVGGVRQIDPWMPWPYLRIMTDDDLKAIFMYLRSQAPVHHFVDNTEPPRLCKLCGTTHGLGDLN